MDSPPTGLLLGVCKLNGDLLGCPLTQGIQANKWSCYRESLWEDDKFPERELAALVAAKVYYQLQDYNESMVFALRAGKLFDINEPGEFEDTIVGKLDPSRANSASS
jgi:hypothetical protein